MTSKGYLTSEEAAKLLALPVKTRSPGRTTPGTSRSKKIDHNDRSWPMWWRLDVTLTNCECASHDEREAERSRMCALVGDKYVCRYCYVNGRDLR